MSRSSFFCLLLLALCLTRTAAAAYIENNTKKHQNDSAGNATFGIIVIVVRILLFFGIGVLFQRCFGFCCCMCNRNNRPDSSKVHTTPHMDTWLGSVVTSSNVRTADKDPLPSYDSVFPSK